MLFILMAIWLAVIGVLIVIVTLIDVLATTLTAAHDGPLTFIIVDVTRFIGFRISRLLLKLPRLRHHFLSSVGIACLFLTFTMWVIGTWIGWALIFLSKEDTIINATSGAPADTVAVFYFIGYTISTLGLGDYEYVGKFMESFDYDRPNGSDFKIYLVLVGFNGFFLLTLAVTHLVSVIQGFVKMRQASSKIWTVGNSPINILINAWNGRDFASLSDLMINFSQIVSEQAQTQRAYPILFGYHSRHKRASWSLAVTSFEELYVLMICAIPTEHQVEKLALKCTERSLYGYLNDVFKYHAFTGKHDKKGQVPIPSLEPLRSEGIPVVTDELFSQRIQDPKIVVMRRQAYKLLKNSGWSWKDVYSGED